MAVLEPTERFKKLEMIACEFKIDKNVIVNRYFRSGSEMLRMAEIYYNEENYESAYTLYHKYVTLFVEKLKHHPGYKAYPSNKKADVVKALKLVMPRLEKLKGLLKQKFSQEFEEWEEHEKLIAKEREKLEEKMKKMKLQQADEKLREDVTKYHDEKERALSMQRDKELAMWHQIQINRELEEEEQNARQQSKPSPPTSSTDPSPSHRPEANIPTLPTVDRGSKPEPVRSPTMPSVPDRSTKPSNSLYSSGKLRDVFVPTMLMAKFLSLADRNTQANIETCGVLAGKLAQNSFRITHLLIPKQSGTSDSCVTECEEAIFEYQDSHDLITLGWIHTHPSQTAFLSSVDLHTHLSYQLMLPEAIAIVMAPKYNETAFLVLTPNHGLDYIANCRQSGFHPHPKEPPLFEEATHIHLDSSSDVVLADLRK